MYKIFNKFLEENILVTVEHSQDDVKEEVLVEISNFDIYEGNLRGVDVKVVLEEKKYKVRHSVLECYHFYYNLKTNETGLHNTFDNRTKEVDVRIGTNEIAKLHSFPRAISELEQTLKDLQAKRKKEVGKIDLRRIPCITTNIEENYTFVVRIGRVDSSKKIERENYGYKILKFNPEYEMSFSERLWKSMDESRNILEYIKSLQCGVGIGYYNDSLYFLLEHEYSVIKEEFEKVSLAFNKRQEEKEKKIYEIQKQEQLRLEHCISEAKNSGKEVLYKSWMAECNNPNLECSLDQVCIYITPTGDRIERRFHSY
jgi:hypothetical protein